MAKLGSNFDFNGPLGNLSAYKMRGVEGTVLRRKGGASKEKIKKAPEFERTRELNAEFGGRATASQWIMHAMWPQKALADYNIAGPVNALLRAIQVLDTEGKRGQRGILLTKNPRLLEGFSLNRQNPFDSTLRNSLGVVLSRESVSAQVDIPALLPGINFFAPVTYPMFSVQLVLGLVPDFVYGNYGYVPSNSGYVLNTMKAVETGWLPVQKGSPATTLQLALDKVPDNSDFSLVLSVGIRYGMMIDAATVQQVKHAGCAKILAMA